MKQARPAESRWNASWSMFGTVSQVFIASCFRSRSASSAPTHASSRTRDRLTQKLHGAIPRGGALHFHEFSVSSALELTVQLPGFTGHDFALVQPVGQRASGLRERVAASTNLIGETAFSAGDMSGELLSKVRRTNKQVIESEGTGVVIARASE